MDGRDVPFELSWEQDTRLHARTLAEHGDERRAPVRSVGRVASLAHHRAVELADPRGVEDGRINGRAGLVVSRRERLQAPPDQARGVGVVRQVHAEEQVRAVAAVGHDRRGPPLAAERDGDPVGERDGVSLLRVRG